MLEIENYRSTEKDSQCMLRRLIYTPPIKKSIQKARISKFFVTLWLSPLFSALCVPLSSARAWFFFSCMLMLFIAGAVNDA